MRLSDFVIQPFIPHWLSQKFIRLILLERHVAITVIVFIIITRQRFVCLCVRKCVLTHNLCVHVLTLC